MNPVVLSAIGCVLTISAFLLFVLAHKSNKSDMTRLPIFGSISMYRARVMFWISYTLGVGLMIFAHDPMVLWTRYFPMITAFVVGTVLLALIIWKTSKMIRN